MNKRLWITCLIVLLVLIAFAVWKSTTSSAATQQTKNEQSSNHTVSNSNDMQNRSKDEILQQSLQTQLQALQKNPGNINQFLNQYRASCHLDGCNAALTKALNAYPNQKFAQTVQNLLKRMP